MSAIARHPNLLRPSDTVLVVVDMQPSLLNAIHGREALLANVRLLLETARLLEIPVIATTQYGARLGGVVPELSDLITAASTPVFDKLTFSCAGQPSFTEHLATLSRHQVLICGIETHICITQTALDLVAMGYQVHVAVDGASSRTMEKHKLGMERLRDSAVLPCATEAAVYELLGEAGTPEFKEILKLVK